jgi:protocatechuate 3,4-dioxygenase beta subunit
VTLQKAAVITGRLLDADGEPIANTQVSGAIDGNQLDLKGGWDGFFHCKTDNEGRFHIAGLVPGVKLSARVTRNYQTVGQIFEHAAFSAGEERDLGNVRVKMVNE